MANIMITDLCNLNCSYCFANQFVNKDSGNHISKEAFDKILDFIETSKTREHVGVIGGEPTLHPDFSELLSKINKRDGIDDVVVFTNGILIDRYFEELKNPKMFLLINCNSPSIIGKLAFDQIRNNIKLAIEKYDMKERITLGVNIFSKDVDYGYIIDLIEEFGCDHLRMSVAVPNDKKECNPLDYYNSLKGVVINLIEETLRHNAMPFFDCNKLPVCILTSEERNRFIGLSGDKAVGNLLCEYSRCSPVLDILQDETCVRCFGMSDDLKVDINGFDTIDDLRGFFENCFDIFANIAYYDEKCVDCYERVCRKCSGGCLKYKISQIEELKNKIL